MNEHCLAGPHSPTETLRRLDAFLKSEQSNPSGEFDGTVSNEWVCVRRTGWRFPSFEYRGAVIGSRDGAGSIVELHITPTLFTVVLLAPVAIAVFVGFVFFAMMLTLGFGFYEGGWVVRMVQILLIIAGVGILAVVLVEPRRTRKRLVQRLRKMGIVDEPAAPNGAM